MFRPNPPRMVTVVLAVALFALGLIGVLPQTSALVEPINDVLVTLPIAVELGLTFDRQLAHLLLLVGPALMIVGSLLRGI